MLNGKWLKFIGIGATVLGAGVTLLTDWVNEKEMENAVKDEVESYLARRDNKDDEES